MKITFVTVSAPALKFLPAAARRVNAIVPGAVSLRLYYAVGELAREKSDRMVADIVSADAVFLDLMGAPPAVIQAVERGCESCKGQVIPYGASSRQYLRLGDFTAASMQSSKMGGGKKPGMEAMKKMQGMAETMGKYMPGKMRDMRNYSLLMKYFQNAGEQNYFNMLLLLTSCYGGISGLPAFGEPLVPPDAAFYDVADMTAYPKQKGFERVVGHEPGKPNVALLFTPYAYPTDTSGCVRAITEALSGCCNVYPIGLKGSFSDCEKTLREYLFGINAALVLDCKPFRLAAGPMGGDADAGIRLLDELGAPFLHPFFLTRRTEKEWRAQTTGCSPGEVLISILLPELDGAVETLPVAAMGEPVIGEDADTELYELQPIPERLERLAERVKKHLALREKPNAEKRVAILCYNYPPGEANLFGGAFLDMFESVAAILKRLKSEGYQTDALTAEQLMEVFCAGHAVNSGKYECTWEEQIRWPVSSYEADPEVETAWGSAPGEIMAEGREFLIPGCVRGNVFIGLQPARGAQGTSDKEYHDKTRPPHHQYAAFYQWIRREFQADAVIHVGTHGTVEFLKGKESGMSGDCWPDRLIADLPHIYLYYCGNPAEAVIAKRRTHAVLVSYQPPVFVQSGLYGEWLDLSAALENYHHLCAVSPSGAPAALDTVRTRARALGLSDDLDEIEAELTRMSSSLIPRGLHVFGSQYTPDEIGEYAQGIAALRAGDGEADSEMLTQAARDAAPAAHNRELDALMEALNDRYIPPRLAGDLFRNPEVLPTGYNLYQFDPRLVPSESAMQRGREICENTLAAYYAEHGCWPQSTAVIAWGLEASRTQGETVGQVLAYLGVHLAPDSHVWNRKFEIIPISELGRPRIDVTMNICGFFRDMFGDLIETLDDLLHQLFALEETDEENYFRAHSKARYRQLLEQGCEEHLAEQLAVARIFGPRAGEYGTGLTNVVETKDWQQESELGAVFTQSLRYVYGRSMNGCESEGLYEDNLRCVDVVSQLRSNTEYELVDLDHYYEFFGGLAKSVEMVKGKKAAMYITDTTGGRVLTETADKSIARGVRTRLLNPKWIDGMLEHKYHGAQKIADRFENIMGLAALTGAVDPRFYDDLEACYVKDENLRRRMAENNPHAYMKILEQMYEYNSRGYWDADEEQLARIRKAYLELEGDIEDEMSPESR
ncbi:MAG: cobaltochelatase subunit CobN [Oscillospiraceae bacterium]